jgi:hypothetical protein
MNLRTIFKIESSPRKIGYTTPVMFAGSCFASEIGEKMAEGKMKVLINPSGTVYNPVSINNTIRLVADNKLLNADDLYFSKGRYISFLHYTDFTSENRDYTLEKINSITERAHQFLKNASFLFITFGTSRVYRFTQTREIVSNCHKLPAALFTKELLNVDFIVNQWLELLDHLQKFNKNLKVIFTISPVRHWKDGAHGNQVSKSILFLATEQLLNHPIVEGYFPAYELLMDDLRDYRYYADDMLHPSTRAIEYIWNSFTESYFEPSDAARWKELYNIRKSLHHRLGDSTPSARKEFASTMLTQISKFRTKNPDIDLTDEISYFRRIEAGE